MKLTKKLITLLLSAVILFTLSAPAFAASFNGNGNNADGADTVQILGLGGVYGINIASTNFSKSFSFNAIIPEGFTAVRLYYNGVQVTDFNLTPSAGYNNYYISVSYTEVTKIIGENIIRLEADYEDEEGGIVTKSTEKAMWLYAQGSENNKKSFCSLNFNSLSDDFNSKADDDKATEILSSGVAISSASGAVDVTNETIPGSLKGLPGNKVLKFAYATKSATAGFYITPDNRKYTQILYFQFYASGEYNLDVAVFGGATTSASTQNADRLLLHDMQKNVWHDV